MNVKTKILGWLLHHANTRANWDRSQFYPLKMFTLMRHGTVDGEDIQHIKHTCWGCSGRGCERCCNTGAYYQFYVRLTRWKLGGYTFHTPHEKYIAPPKPVTITGRIEHHATGKIGFEAMLWLYLWKDRRSLANRMTDGGAFVGFYLWPLLNVHRVIMMARRLWFKARNRLGRHECWCGCRWWNPLNPRQCPSCALRKDEGIPF